MKTYQFILTLVLLSYCSTQATETCSSNFKDSIDDICAKIGDNCERDNYGCYRRGCSNAKTSEDCILTLPNSSGTSLHLDKCAWVPRSSAPGYHCTEAKKTCDDYNIFGNEYIHDGGDTCSNLQSLNNREKCALEANDKDKCVSHYANCSMITNSNTCNNIDNYRTNFVSDFSVQCFWNNTDGKCHPKKRECEAINGISSLNITNNNEIKCSDFDAGNDKCIYFKGRCRKEKVFCKDLSKSQCLTFNSPPISNIRFYNMPLNNNDYDYTQKCVWNENSDECQADAIICSDYDRNEDMCKIMSNCVYDTNSKKCNKKYDTCKSYSDEETDKNRTKCQNSTNINEQCNYILRTDECKAKETYNTCGDYNKEEGPKDKIICESIRSTNPPYYCVLDKDNECVERVLNCSEVYDKEDCLHIAKASDPNKKCAYKSGKCVEEYIRCEDFEYDTNSYSFSQDCIDIKLYNGLQCEPESNRCKTRNKKCREANSKEECKLIAKTGVSNPERKVCEYFGNQCSETFKYCSDYRGTNSTECYNIIPYDQYGEKIDEFSKCVFEEGKCQRVPKNCSDADDNPILCAEISPYIKDNSTKYCRYNKYKNDTYKNKCIEDYKTCESYRETSTNGFDTEIIDKATICYNIIPQGYNKGICKFTKDERDGIYKCVSYNNCSAFDEKIEEYSELCNNQSNKECSYKSSSATCENIERTCNEIRFNTADTGSEEYCNKFEASKPFKKCSLKEDKSGCEEKYIELDFSTAASSYKNPPGSESVESSEIVKGIHLIMILLCLLF